MNKKNIIYFLPAQKHPSGGAKIIYHHSNLINQIKDDGINSCILHYKKKRISKYLESVKKIFIKSNKNKEIFGYNFKDFKIIKNFLPNNEWINTKIKNKNELAFNSKNDFLIFPEIIAHFAKNICFKKNIKYAIFIQGVYHMYQINDLKKLSKIYEKAEFIITTSLNTKASIIKIFPRLKKKIIKLSLSIDPNIFKPKAKKKIITCIPRKLEEDFRLLKFFLYKRIPKPWKIISLKNISSKVLIKTLNKSKIFLSFSNLEGLGLPPLEAAISGNKVIGYTGEGGKEYFKKPLFERVMKSDLLDFSNKIIKNIKDTNNNWHLKKNILHARKLLIKKYSLNNEIDALKKIINRIKKA